MSQHNSKFQFCPYCYEDFFEDEENPIGDNCPFCGSSLLDYLDDKDGTDEPDFADGDETLGGSPRSEAQSNADASLAQGVKKKKKTVRAEYHEYQNYSIILKACDNKESLGNNLEKVFKRDIFAIRLALNNLPTVIVYKGNIRDMEAVLNSFYMANAAVSILGGEVKLSASIHEQYPILFKQPLEIQNMFYQSPVQLWLGDRIYTACISTMQGKSGMLVITDQGLYFLDTPGEPLGCRWFIVPYYQVKDISYFEDEMGKGIFAKWETRLSDTSSAFQHEKFYIEDKEQIRTAIDLALLSYDAGNFRQKIIVRCQSCDYCRRELLLGERAVTKICPRCGSYEIDLALLVRNRI